MSSGEPGFDNSNMLRNFTSTTPSQGPSQLFYSSVSLEMAAKLNSPDENRPMPIEYLVRYTEKLHVGYRHVLFARGVNQLQDNFLNYYATLGIVSALVLGVSLAAVTQAPRPDPDTGITGRRLHNVFVSILLLSCTFSTATVMLSTVYYVRFSSCVEMEGIVDFLVTFPPNAPDYCNTIASALFSISLCLLVFLLLPRPWSMVVGAMSSMLVFSTASAIIWMVVDAKTERDNKGYQYFDEVNALVFEDSR